jgi:hypothetical protein
MEQSPSRFVWDEPQQGSEVAAFGEGIAGADCGHRDCGHRALAMIGPIPGMALATSGCCVRLVAAHIAAAPYRLDVVMAARCLGELFAQLTEEYIDDLELRLVHPAIEAVKNHFLSEDGTLAG